jgi:hypothetical protein
MRLEYSPVADLLIRGGQILRVPPDVARRVEAGTSLAPGGRRLPWRPVALGLVLAALGAAALGPVARSRIEMRRFRSRPSG